VITPHNSSDADLGVETQLRVLRENLRRYLAGDRLLSVVEVARGY
jgi:phosphoglycerate dehydrogenase-like enzyme